MLTKGSRRGISTAATAPGWGCSACASALLARQMMGEGARLLQRSRRRSMLWLRGQSCAMTRALSGRFDGDWEALRSAGVGMRALDDARGHR